LPTPVQVGTLSRNFPRGVFLQTGLSANLDLLRAVAVLLVLAQHLLIRFQWADKLGIGTPTIGTFGVLLFFVHTCLVLMYSMERSNLDGRRLVENFYIRRVFRIYPLSILAVLTAVALHLDSGINGITGLSRTSTIPLGRILSNLLLVQNLIKPGSILNVLWSLPYEVQMYIFLPFLFLRIRGKSTTLRRLGILWAVSVLVAILHRRVAGTFPLDRLAIVQYVPCFLPGVIAFVLPHVPRLRSVLWLPFILVLVCVYAIFPSMPAGWILCLILGLAIPFFGEIKTGWLRWISHQTATYSYGIYLSHQFCIWLVADIFAAWPVWIKLSALAVVLVVIPVVLYHAIEKPMIRAGVHFAEKWDNKRLIAAATAETGR
jgi:peptidoglycan/LPS O-acetylase OafA/YrhL